MLEVKAFGRHKHDVFDEFGVFEHMDMYIASTTIIVNLVEGLGAALLVDETIGTGIESQHPFRTV